VRYADRPSRVLSDGDILDGEDVVPGFRLDLAELFGPSSLGTARGAGNEGR
jgi:hypothetical protein